MKIIIPMAGMGKRMRPHTLTVPKPLLHIAGKSIVHRLVENIVKVTDESVDEVVFVIGRFGSAVEEQLVDIAEGIGAKGTIRYQDDPLGTAHAILCAGDALEGKVIVAFADTLFKANFQLDASREGIIWTSQVEDPSAFGVVKLNAERVVEAFVEKPETFVSDQAIIGIYYFQDGAYLRQELQRLIDEDIRIKGGEFGLTDALENMKQQGTRFLIDTVDEWLDCGNKDATVYTNQRMLEFLKEEENLVHDSATVKDSVIIPPCYIGPGVHIERSVIGPHVSVHANTTLQNCVIQNSIVYTHTELRGMTFENSMVGNHVRLVEPSKALSIGDYSFRS